MDISISLAPELLDLIKAKLESGRYNSTSEVVAEALRLLDRTDKLDTHHVEGLRPAWQEGVDSGDAGALDFAELRAAARHELASLRKG